VLLPLLSSPEFSLFFSQSSTSSQLAGATLTGVSILSFSLPLSSPATSETGALDSSFNSSLGLFFF